VPPGGQKIEKLKLSYMNNTKLRKHHKMSQGMKTLIEVLVQCPLVAKNPMVSNKLQGTRNLFDSNLQYCYMGELDSIRIKQQQHWRPLAVIIEKISN
jgi:hypothetical protein